MQTLPPSSRFAKAAGPALTHGSRCCANINRSVGQEPPFQVTQQAGALLIGLWCPITVLRFACRPNSSGSAVRLSRRPEMLVCRAKLVRRSRFAPAAQPQVSSSRAAPRRSVSITHSAQAVAVSELHGWSRPVRLARLSIAVFNQAMSSPATAANALPNHSLNRTRCGMPAFGPPFHSGPNAATPQRAG